MDAIDYTLKIILNCITCYVIDSKDQHLGGWEEDQCWFRYFPIVLLLEVTTPKVIDMPINDIETININKNMT